MSEKNRKIFSVLINGEHGKYVSEVQQFDKPEDYEDAFKRYYPENKKV